MTAFGAEMTGVLGAEISDHDIFELPINTIKLISIVSYFLCFYQRQNLKLDFWQNYVLKMQDTMIEFVLWYLIFRRNSQFGHCLAIDDKNF